MLKSEKGGNIDLWPDSWMSHRTLLSWVKLSFLLQSHAALFVTDSLCDWHHRVTFIIPHVTSLVTLTGFQGYRDFRKYNCKFFCFLSMSTFFLSVQTLYSCSVHWPISYVECFSWLWCDFKKKWLIYFKTIQNSKNWLLLSHDLRKVFLTDIYISMPVLVALVVF